MVFDEIYWVIRFWVEDIFEFQVCWRIRKLLRIHSESCCSHHGEACCCHGVTHFCNWKRDGQYWIPGCKENRVYTPYMGLPRRCPWCSRRVNTRS